MRDSNPGFVFTFQHALDVSSYGVGDGCFIPWETSIGNTHVAGTDCGRPRLEFLKDGDASVLVFRRRPVEAPSPFVLVYCKAFPIFDARNT